MGSFCITCGYKSESCLPQQCPRCNTSMLVESCGSCTKCTTRGLFTEKISWHEETKKKKEQKV